MNLTIPNKVPLVSIFFILVVFFLPIIDNLTGALFKLKMISEGGIGSPSQIARFASFILVIWLVNISKVSSSLKIILLATCYLLLVEVCLALIHMNIKAFLYGLVYSTKLLFSISCYFFVANWLNYDKEKTLYTIKHIINYGTIVSILILIAYTSGFHISNYEIGIATRGLFISGNGLGIVLGISTIFLINYSKKFTFFKLLHIALLILTTALLGTKASLIFLFVALILLFIKLVKQAPIISSIILIIFSIYLIIPLFEILSSIFENIIYKFNYIDNKLRFIASSRDKFIYDAFNQINLLDFNALRIFFGGGAYYSYTDYFSGSTLIRKSLENDLFELFFCYGIFITITYIGIYFYAVKKALRMNNWVIALSLSLVFFHSITMGHVLFNGTSAITYVLCLALAMKGAKVHKNDF